MRILCLGDSIMQYNDFSTYPQTGWVQEFARFFPLSTEWLNFARNGRSSKSFIDEGRFALVLKTALAGDYALIQFGHNDEKNDPCRHTDPGPGGSFRKNLSYFVQELKKKGVRPVLLTPVARRMFEAGRAKDSHKKYAEAILETASEEEIPCIDLNKISLDFLNEIGFDDSRRYFMNFDKNLYKNYPDGKNDNSHLRPDGANMISALAAVELKTVLADFPDYAELSEKCMTSSGNPFLEVSQGNSDIDDEYKAFV